MACQKRDNTGSCGHHQCPFINETNHGYECVDLMTGEVDGTHVQFCEVGDGCLEKCPHSWVKGSGTPVERAAEKWCEDIERELQEYFQTMEEQLSNKK